MSVQSQADLLFSDPPEGAVPLAAAPPPAWSAAAVASVGAAKWKALSVEQQEALVSAMWTYSTERAQVGRAPMTAGEAELRLRGWVSQEPLAGAIRLLNTVLPLVSRGEIPAP